MAKHIEGKNEANPVSMMLSSVFMLRHLGLKEHADRIETAIMETIASAKVKLRSCVG